jgi:Caspase domain
VLIKFFPLSSIRFVLFILILLLAGCATPVIKMPKTVPDGILKEYKSFKLNGSDTEWIDSGIRVVNGDYLTIMAKGKIQAHSGTIDPAWKVVFQIGKDGKFNFYTWWAKWNNHRIREDGNIFLRVTKGHESRPGFFVVDLIVWKKEDPIGIANFLDELRLKDPDNETLKDFAREFKIQKEVILAEQKAKEEVEETEKAILALKREKVPVVKEMRKEDSFSEGSEKEQQERVKQALENVKQEETVEVKEADKAKQTAELTDKLHKALQSLKELEELKKRLAEQQEKEKELMVRLEQAEAGKQLQTPPVIALATPKDGVSVDSEYISLFGVVEHDKGIDKFEILVNQQWVGPKDRKGLKIVPKDSKRVDFSERVRLREGKNEISVIAQNKDGLTAKKTISIQWLKKRDEVWAVVIGIDEYKNFPSLKYSKNDAREFYHYLTEVNQVPRDHVWLLLDEEATLNRMRSVLGTQLRRNAGKDDMVIVYLAGHGATESDAASPDGDGLEKYILPHEADPKDLYASAMPMGEVARIFSRISSERLVFISDTCYSGATGGRTVPVLGMRANVSGAFWDRLSQGTGRVIITASDANEVSIEKDDLKHGVFTYYLLEALQGKGDLDGNGVITVDEVYRYVSIRVPQATGQEQHPVKKGEVKGEIVLGVVK